jgi:hypothetical protein
MGFKLERVHIWSGEIVDEAGAMAKRLAPLAEAGANLEFIAIRPGTNKPGFGVLYVAPITGPSQVRAARLSNLSEARDAVVLRVEGDNEAGLGYRLTKQWATAGISLQSVTMAVVGSKFVAFAAFDTVGDANRAAQILADLGSSEAVSK